MAKSITNVVKFYMTKQEDMVKGKYIGEHDHYMSFYDPNNKHNGYYTRDDHLDYKTKKCNACHWCEPYDDICKVVDKCIHFMYINCPKCSKRTSYGYIISCDRDCYMFDCYDCGTMVVCGRCVNDKDNTVQILDYKEICCQSADCFEDAKKEYPGITQKPYYDDVFTYIFPPNTIFYKDVFGNCGFTGSSGGLAPSVYACNRCGRYCCTNDK